MPKVIPHKKFKGQSGKVREYHSRIVNLEFNNNLEPILVTLSNGMKGRGSCLGCIDAPCMNLSRTNMKLPKILKEFPGDPALEVCPTTAITWDDSHNNAVVNGDECICCGLCVARCPYGAIHLTREGVAVVESGDPDRLTVDCVNAPNHEEHFVLDRIGQIGPINFTFMQKMPDSLTNLNDTQSSRLVRNLLIECGIMCRTRRKGDTNVRMDGVLSTTDGRLGVIEIELSNAVLESPRALMEDVSVLHSRYGITIDSIDPVSVILSLPNYRSEYFQVISDIEQVLGLRCRTITVGALLSVLWQFKKITGFSTGLFVTSPNNADLLPSMKCHFSNDFSEIEPYLGAYRPGK